ncbi:MAG TPA: hypothetical protein VFK10_05240 [Burkholderiaceae bacterium]|nr:hypothetical protein [Burkholderiaceae bacterium]
MALTVKQRGQHIATFRFVEVRLMEMLSAWVPTTAEMEAKLLFGPHIWDTAQAADALGKRAHELRLPLQHSIAPVASYIELLSEIAAVTGAARRIAAMYDVMLPSLDVRYRRYLQRTDTLMDAPSVRVIEGILIASERMRREAQKLRAELPALRCDDQAWLQQLAGREESVPDLLADNGAIEARRAA